MSKSNFTIWLNHRHYWVIDLIPIQNEFGESINRCALVDSELKKEIEALNFSSEWLLPIFKNKDNEGLKKIGLQLKEISDKNGINMISKAAMPEDKRIKRLKGKLNEKKFK